MSETRTSRASLWSIRILVLLTLAVHPIGTMAEDATEDGSKPRCAETFDPHTVTCTKCAKSELSLNFMLAASQVGEFLTSPYIPGGYAGYLCLPPPQIAKLVEAASATMRELCTGDRRTSGSALGRLLEVVATDTNAHAGLVDQSARALLEILSPRYTQNTAAVSTTIDPDSILQLLLGRLQQMKMRAAERRELQHLVARARSARSGSAADGRAALGAALRRTSEIAVDPEAGIAHPDATEIVQMLAAAATGVDPVPVIQLARVAGQCEELARLFMTHARPQIVADCEEAMKKAPFAPDPPFDAQFLSELSIDTGRSSIEVVHPPAYYWRLRPDCDGEWRLDY